MKNKTLFAMTLGLSIFAWTAGATLVDDFDSYSAPSALGGQGGWTASGAGSQTVIADATAPSSPNSLAVINPEAGSTLINRVVAEPAVGKGTVQWFMKHDSANVFSATAGIVLEFNATLPGGTAADRFFSAGFVRDDDRFIWNTFGNPGNPLNELGGQSANGSVAIDTWYQFTVAYEFTPVTFDKTVDVDIRAVGSGTPIVSETVGPIRRPSERIRPCLWVRRTRPGRLR